MCDRTSRSLSTFSRLNQALISSLSLNGPIIRQERFVICAALD